MNGAQSEGMAVLRVDGAYLYEFGIKMGPINQLPDKDSKLVDLFFILEPVRSAIGPLIFNSVFSGGLRTAAGPANKLLDEINQIVPVIGTADVDWGSTVPGWRISSVKSAFKSFEAVLMAELQTSALYYVPTKGGFDTTCLTDDGEALFPSDLAAKVPGAVADVKAGARCLAFDLHTAAGFHFHRACEAVLRTYFDVVAGSSNRPRTRNMGDFLNKMRELDKGDAKVIEVLKSLKDLHRNPLMHPEDTIATIDEAFSLYAAVRAAIGYMLDRISSPQLPVVAGTNQP